MPGLLGIIKTSNFDEKKFKTALASLSYARSDVQDSLLKDKHLIASRVHLGIIGNKNSPFQQGDLFLWIEGEIYNGKDLSSKNFNEAICEAYSGNQLSDLLGKIDGYYVAVLYDQKKGKIIMWSDRYGLKPLYYSDPESFSWSSELKSFKHFLNIDYTNLDYAAIEYFIEHGQFVGDRTYFKNIKLLNASTLLCYDICTKKITTKRYWAWSSIKQQKFKFTEASEELFKKLSSSVSSRLDEKDEKHLGLTLSGGIDSRVLLSLAPSGTKTVTFGTKNCIDYKIAKQVAKKNSNPHQLFELGANNWLDGRIEAIKVTGGMFNMQHMHSAPFLKDFKEKYKININGFAGDLNVGGGWITKPNERISEKSILEKFGDISEFIDHTDSFYDSPHEDPFYLDVRARRFTTGGTIQSTSVWEQIKPFYSNEIMDFLYSLPDEYRINGKLYRDMIIKRTPQLFKNVHTTHNIFPLGQENNPLTKLKIKFNHGLIKLGIKPHYKWQYTSYSEWYDSKSFHRIRKDVGSNVILEKLPMSDKYIGYLNSDSKIEEKNLSKAFAFITAEVWLRYFFNLPIQGYSDSLSQELKTSELNLRN